MPSASLTLPLTELLPTQRRDLASRCSSARGDTKLLHFSNSSLWPSQYLRLKLSVLYIKIHYWLPDRQFMGITLWSLFLWLKILILQTSHQIMYSRRVSEGSSPANATTVNWNVLLEVGNLVLDLLRKRGNWTHVTAASRVCTNCWVKGGGWCHQHLLRGLQHGFQIQHENSLWIKYRNSTYVVIKWAALFSWFSRGLWADLDWFRPCRKEEKQKAGKAGDVLTCWHTVSFLRNQVSSWVLGFGGWLDLMEQVYLKIVFRNHW